MESSDLQVVVDLFKSHLSTIDLIISTVAGVLVVAGFLTWRGIRNTIKDTVDTKISELVSAEREKIKTLIKGEVSKITKEEADKLFYDSNMTASINEKQEM